MKKNSVFTILSLPISIPLTVIFIVKGLSQNNISVLFPLSLVMSIFAFLSIPYDTMDIVRYYEIYDNIEKISLYEIYNINEGNFIVNLYIKLLNDLSISKQFLPFTATFISYYFFFKSILFIRKKESIGFTRKELLFITITALFGVGFYFSASGIRTGVALSLALYAIVMLNYNKKIISSLFFALAISIHFLTIIILLITILSFISKRTNLFRILFIISPILAIISLGEGLVTFIFHFLGDTLKTYGLYRISYIEGEWGTSFYALRNIKTYIYEKFIYLLPFYASYFYLLFIRNDSFFRRVIYILFFISFLFFDFRTLLMRYSYFTSLVFFLILAIELNINSTSRKIKTFAYIFFISCVLYSSGSVYKYRDTFMSSWGKTLYQPTIFLFLNDINTSDYIIRED